MVGITTYIWNTSKLFLVPQLLIAEGVDFYIQCHIEASASFSWLCDPVIACQLPVLIAATSFTNEVNPWLAKRPLKTNGLAHLELTSSVEEATRGQVH